MDLFKYVRYIILYIDFLKKIESNWKYMAKMSKNVKNIIPFNFIWDLNSPYLILMSHMVEL